MSSLALVPISIRANSKCPASSLNDEVFEALLWARDRILNAPPKIICCKDVSKPFLIFTDGAFELTPRPLATVGSVLFHPDKRSVSYFGSTVPDKIIQTWRSLGSKQVIHQTEILPVLISVIMWADVLRDHRVFVFVDNEGAKNALISHSSSNCFSRKILRAVAEVVTDANIYVWFSRVPSKSNIADGPSRLNFECVQKLNNSKQLELDWTETCQRIGA